MADFCDCCVVRVTAWEVVDGADTKVTFESVCLKDNTVRVDTTTVPGGAAMAPEAVAAAAWDAVKADAEAWCDAKQPPLATVPVGKVFDPTEGTFK